MQKRADASLGGATLSRIGSGSNRLFLYVVAPALAVVTAGAICHSVLAAFAVLAALFVVLCFIKPEVGLVATVLAMPWQRTDFPTTRWMSGVAVLGGLVGWLRPYLAGKSPTNRARMPTHMWLAIGLLAYSFLSLLVRGFEQAWFQLEGLGGLIYGTMSIQAVALAIVVGSMSNSKRKLQLVVMICFVQAIVISVIGLQEPFTGKTLVEFFHWTSRSYVRMDHRISSIFYDPNLLANFLAPIILLAVGSLRLTSAGGRLRGLSWAVLIAAIPAMIATMSVSNFLGMTVGVVVVWVCTKSRKLAVAAAFCVALGFALILGPTELLPRPAQMLQDKASDLIESGYSEDARFASIALRARMIVLALRLWRTEPWLGAGHGAFQTKLRDDPLTPVGPSGELKLYPHNSYFLLLSELGIVGIGLLMWFLITLVATAVNNMKRLKNTGLGYLQACVLGGIVESLVFSWTYGSLSYNLNFWFLVGLTSALRAAPWSDQYLPDECDIKNGAAVTVESHEQE